MATGDNIKNLRLKREISQPKFADAAGKAVPRMNAIQKTADFFGVKKSEIIEPSANVQAPNSRAKKIFCHINLNEPKLISDYRNLNGNNRQAIDVMTALFLSRQTGDNFNLNAAAV